MDNNNNNDDLADQTQIQKFYYKKSIFITGGSGFVGKVIIDKLLRVCDIENIYVLIRTKNDKDTSTRIDDLFEDPLFETLKSQKPKFRHKIVPIVGDCAYPGLGISNEDLHTIQKNVSIVFHVAATVRFDEKLKMAMEINVGGTKGILALCRKIENLKAVVHVSTAYANCVRNLIDEKLYEQPVNVDDLLKLCETLDEQTLNEITPKLLENYPNTYTYSKALAEDLVRTESKGLPLVVFRPAIVISTNKDPVSGWTDNVYGATGIVLGVAVGLLRILQVAQDNRAEIVPVDMCVNSIICSAWDVAVNTYEEPPVYNYVTAKNNPVSWRQFHHYNLDAGKYVPSSQSVWHYAFTMNSNWFLVAIMQLFYHIIPALLMDAGLFILRKKTRMIKMYEKIHRFCHVLTYFTSTKLQFPHKNVEDLFTKMTHADKLLFDFDMSAINWKDVLGRQVVGLRRYLLKEGNETLPYAKKKAMVLKYAHYLYVWGIYAFLAYFVYFNIIQKYFPIQIIFSIPSENNDTIK